MGVVNAARWTVVLVGVAAVACAPPAAPEPVATVVLPPPSIAASTAVAGEVAAARRDPTPVGPDPLCELAREKLDLERQIDAGSPHEAELLYRLLEVQSKACELADGSTSPCAEHCTERHHSGPCLCDAGDPLCSCIE